MEDKEVFEKLYSIVNPWSVFRVAFNNNGNSVDVFLEHDEGCRWHCPVYNGIWAITTVIEYFNKLV